MNVTSLGKLGANLLESLNLFYKAHSSLTRVLQGEAWRM